MASLPAPPLSLAGLRILILGRGRVGRALATGLAARGAVVGVSSGSAPIPDLTTAALVLLAVPDDSIAEVAARLAPQLVAGQVGAGQVGAGQVVAGQVVAGQVVAHTSGRHGLAVLDAVRAAGAHGLAFHPVMTFTGSGDDVERISGARVGLTADPGARELALRLCAALGATPTWVAEEQRALYHAGLTHAANHLVTLIAEAQQLLVRAGVDDPSAVLSPLVTAALTGVLDRGAFATSGPVVRGDTGTIGEHLQVLAAAAPQMLPSYRALASSTARLAAADGRLSEMAAAGVAGVLAVGVPA